MTLDLAKTYYNDQQYSKALNYSQRVFNFYLKRLTEDCPIVSALFYLGRRAAKTMKWTTAISICIKMLEVVSPPKDRIFEPEDIL